MKIGLQSYKSSLITLVVIAGLAACLIFTVARLLNVESDLRTEDTHVNLWQISQTQFEAALLSESLARYAAQDAFENPEQTPVFRLAILISRLGVLFEGSEQGRFIEQIGMMGRLKHEYLQLTLAEPLVVAGLSPEAALRLRAQSRSLAS